jgi:hypothetical protein
MSPELEEIRKEREERYLEIEKAYREYYEYYKENWVKKVWLPALGWDYTMKLQFVRSWKSLKELENMAIELRRSLI